MTRIEGLAQTNQGLSGKVATTFVERLGSGAECEVWQLMFREAYALGQDDAETVNQCGLRGVWLSDAAQADLAVCSGRQDDVVRLYRGKLFEDGTRRVAEAGSLLPHLETFPQYEGEEANEDMGLNAVLSLVPDGTQVQLILLDAK